jgi:hypothetical protein
MEHEVRVAFRESSDLNVNIIKINLDHPAYRTQGSSFGYGKKRKKKECSALSHDEGRGRVFDVLRH